MTRQRAVILEVMRSDMCHHTAEEIFSLAKEKLPSISRATVYNNLKALEEEQVIRRINGEDGVARYDKSYIPHGHLFCSSCKKIYDFNIPNFSSTIMGYTDAYIDSYELSARGICPQCKQNQE
jgi:Fe2+ or Zn2+ uptake regulation protein